MQLLWIFCGQKKHSSSPNIVISLQGQFLISVLYPKATSSTDDISFTYYSATSTIASFFIINTHSQWKPSQTWIGFQQITVCNYGSIDAILQLMVFWLLSVQMQSPVHNHVICYMFMGRMIRSHLWYWLDIHHEVRGLLLFSISSVNCMGPLSSHGHVWVL